MKQNNHKAASSNGDLHINKKVAGGATGAVVGAMMGGPVGAIIGGVVGTALGSAAGTDKRGAGKARTATRKIVAKAKTVVKKTSRKPAVKKLARAAVKTGRKARSEAVHVAKSFAARKKAKKKK